MEIWDAKGNKVLDSVVTQNAEHVEELMQADYVSLQWVSNVKRVLPAGAYIVPFDDGVRYMLLDPYTPDQNNTDEFTYSPQFQHPKMYLGRVPYSRASKDTEGNDINLLDWDYKGYLTTFLSDLCGFITKTFTDEGITTDKFSYSVLGDIEGNVTISISNNDILSVLNNVCNTLDCEWHIDWEQRRLFVGNVRFDKNEGETLELTSGVNVGMASVSSQSDTYYNVYLPQGSTRNMAAATSDGSYYATNRRLELDPEKYPDGKIYTDGGGNVVTKEQFLEAKLPKLVQTLMLDEIYPKIDLYVYDVRNRERYLLDDNGDKVIDHYEGETPVYKRYAIWYMRLAYPIYNTDGTIRSWKDATLGDTFKLIDGYTLMCSFGANTDSTLTSPLAGREFELNYVETDKEAKELSAKADSDKGDTGVEVKKGDYEIIYTTEGNLIIPTTEEQGLVPKGESSPSKNGNKVTIFNVVMGEDFIKAAQNDLEVAAIREIKKQYSDLNQYTFNSDNVAFKKDMPSLYIGRSIKYNDGVGNTLDTRIMKLTTKLDFPFMVEITVGNKVLKGSTSQLKTDVQMILSGNRQTASNGITESVVRSLIKGFGGANFLSKVNDDTARGIITFLQGTNWGSFTSETGAAMTVDPTTGQTYMEVDRLKVRLKAFFEQLEVQKVGYVGGKIVVSKGQGVDILDVEEVFDSEGNLSAYRCYFLGEQEGRRINNLLRVNDQMICKDENISEGSTDGATNKYYWRLVTAVSSDVVKRGNNVCHWVDLSATDCDTNSDIPSVGDTICQLGNRTDIDRQGAEILSVVDANSPSFTIYSGINSYSLVNKEYIDMGVAGGKAFCNIYGSTYIGDRERSTGYLRWNDDTKTFEIKGIIDISSPLSSGGTIGGAINNAANAYKDDFSTFTSNVNEIIGGFQAQIDGVIETWFYDPEPTLGNLPASEWKDNTTKDKHLGDLYYSKAGKAYRFQKEGDTYKWVEIMDTDITKALEEAKAAKDAAAAAQGTADTAQNTANSKMKVFVVQPTNNDEYSVGDMWVNATYPADGSTYSNEILKCKEGKAAGAEFTIAHWEKASKYTDDTKANEAQKTANAAAAAAKNIDDAILAIDNNVDVALKDKIITKTEAAAITEALNSLSAIMADVIKTYAELENNDVYKLIAADTKQDFDDAYKKLVATFDALSDYITNTLTKANPITSEILSTYNTHYTNFKTDYEAYVSKLNVVRNSMDALLNTRIGDIASMLGGLEATQEAMDGTTKIDGGLILSSLIALGYKDSSKNFNVMSGVSGLYEDDTEKGGGIAFWAGGHRIDINDCKKNEEGKYTFGGKVVNPADFLVRHDGTGYAAGGALWWEKDGKVHADPQSFLINEQYVGNVMQLFEFVYSGGTAFENIVHAIPQKPFESLSVGANGLTLYNGDKTAKLHIKNGVLFIEGDLAVTGGITMYASDGVKSGMIDQVYAVLDQSLFSIVDGVITITGEIGSGTVKGIAIKGTQYDPDNNGIIALTLNWGDLTGVPTTFTPSAHTHNDLYYTETEIDTKLAGKSNTGHTHDDRYYIKSEIDTKLGLKLDTSLKGAANGLATLDSSGKVPSAQLPSYVDDVLECINKASFPATGEGGKIYIDQTTNLTYRWGGTTYVEISQSLALGETSSTAYAGDKGKQNAADIAALKTGKADKATTLAGYGITDAYTQAEVNTKLTDGSVTKVGKVDVGSATKPIYLKAGVPTAVGTSLVVDITGNSATTSKLKTAVTLWGQSFDGSKAITGNLTNVGTITPTGEDLKVVGNLIVTGGIVMYADDGATIESGFAALLAAHIDGVTIKYNSTEQKIYSVMSGIAVNGTTYKPNETTGIITIPNYPTSLDWGKIENKPTTISGYGITDAKIVNGVITLGTATITPLTAHQTVTLASGTNNGTLKLTVGSTTTDNIAVKGLGSAAYTAASAYAAASHTHSYLPLAGGTMTGGITFSNSSHLQWNSGSYHQRIFLTDDSTADTAVFTFQQSTDSGTNWSNLMVIRDNGKVIANTFVGALSGNASTASKWATARKITLSGSVTGSVSIDGSGDVTLTTTTNHTHSYVPLSGGTMTGNLILKGGTSADMTYAGNVHPYIRFDNSDSSQNVSLIFTDYDSYRSPAGLKLVGSQGNEWFEAANIYATTFYGALSGNATTASKLGTANVGSGTQHFYLSSGTATASTSTVGGTAKPMYLKAGVMTAISDTVGGTAKPIFLNAGTLTAISATVGSASKPVYLSSGSITACSYDFTSYLPLEGGTMAAGARISHADGNMYIGRADNNGWVMCQDLCSQSGSTYWKLMTNGTFHSLVAVVSGNTSVGSLTINGINVTKSSDGILKIDGNLIVTGGITMYATDGVASGLMEQILVDGTTIGKKADGTLYAINTGNVRSIIMGSTTYTPNDSGAVTLPEKVTWANIEGKPSTFTPSSHTHAISQITNLQATLDGKAAASHAHSYLPLSGGTMSGYIFAPEKGIIFYGSVGATTGAYITGSSEGVYINGYKYVTLESSSVNYHPRVRLNTVDYPLLSTYNYNSYVPTLTGTGASGTWGISISGNAAMATNADTVDGYHASSFLIDRGGAYTGLIYDLPCKSIFSGFDLTDAPVAGWVSGLILGSNWNNDHYQHYLVESGSRWYATRARSSDGKMTNWNTFAYLTDNVASATKLQTARAIWGQSFDGSNNVDGTLTMLSTFTFSGIFPSNNYILLKVNNGQTTWEAARIGTYIAANNGGTDGYPAGLAFYTKPADGSNSSSAKLRMVIDANGNVGIGTTSPSYKLHVNGTLGVSGITTFNINNQWLTPSVLQIGRADTSKDASKAVIGVTDGNLHIDAYHNKELYLNYYNKGKIKLGYQTGSYYISENGSYYSGNSATATKLTTSAGSATLPIYFSDGKPVACTASSVFSNLSNSGNNISVTVAGQNRTLTVGYASNADTLDGVQGDYYFKRQGRLGAYNIDTLTEFASRDIQPSHEETISGTKPFNSWGTLLTFKSLTDNGGIQIAGGDNRMYFRNAYNSSFENKNWNAIAYLTDTVANSDTCDGLHVHGGRNNEANKIVRTDGNGYIQCGYINSSSGNEGNNSSPARVWGTNGSDNYMRTYLTSALSVKYAASAGNADTLDGNHASAFATAGHNHFTRLDAVNIDTGLSHTNNWHYEISNATGTLPFSATWRQVYVMGGNDLNFTVQISTGLTDNNPLYYRHRRSGSWDAWRTILDSSNYNSYAPSKTGTGASGTWGISVSGNAATTSKWATARTITLSGSVTGSVSIDGSGNVTLATTTNHTHSYLPLSGGTMTGTINANDNVQNTGIKFKNNNANLNALGNQHLILGTAIRFGEYNTWDWNVWAGLKYDRADKTIYLGLADGTTFNANSAQSGGKVKFPGVSNLYISEIDDAGGGNGLVAYKPAAWTGVSSSQTGFGTITTETVIRSSNSSLKHYRNGSGTYTIWDSGNHGSGSGLNADLLDGVQYINILERSYTGSKYDSAATTKTGWYRIAECYGYNRDGFLLYIGRNYHSSNNENYIFAITVTYNGNISISQIAGSANTRLISKIRVCWSNTSSNKAYVDVYVGTEAINGFFWYTVGGAKSYGTWSASPSTSGYSTVEFSTCNGMSSNKDFYIRGQIVREGKNSSWIVGRTNAMIRQTTANGYSPFASIKTVKGSWEIGDYTDLGERLLFTYITDTNYNNSNNNHSGQISFESGGNILASGGITMYSDLRKKNILSYEVLSVKEIAAAPLFRHTYKSDDNQYIHVGTSAQYWSGIHEDWFTRKDSEGYYQMELQNLGVAMGISLAREIVTFEGAFKKYESKTDKKIRLMRKKINDLEARIKELEGSREERRTA